MTKTSIFFQEGPYSGKQEGEARQQTKVNEYKVGHISSY